MIVLEVQLALKALITCKLRSRLFLVVTHAEVNVQDLLHRRPNSLANDIYFNSRSVQQLVVHKLVTRVQHFAKGSRHDLAHTPRQ